MKLALRLFSLSVMVLLGSTVQAGESIPDYRVNGWKSPVDYRSYESCYQFRQYGGHVGGDLCRNMGTEVRAIADGCVEDYGTSLSYYGGISKEDKGGAVLLRHNISSGRVFYAVYGHNTPNASYLNERRCDGGAKIVKAGDVIAWVHEYVGSSDHVHFGIRPDAVDPDNAFRGNGCDNSDNCGWVDPFAFLMENEPLDTSEALTLRCAFGYCWHPASYSDRCEDGTHHAAMTDSIIMHPVSKDTACTGAWTYCHALADGSQVSSVPARNFWDYIKKWRNNSKSDAPFWNLFDLCDRQEVLGAMTARARFDGTYEMVSGISQSGDLNAYPQLAEMAILNPEPHIFPDIRIWSVGVFDEEVGGM